METPKKKKSLKDITFKDMIDVDYTDGSYPEDTLGQIAYDYDKKMKGVVGEDLDEALTMLQRMKRRAIMRKNKAKILMGRRRAMRKRASTNVLQKRALRAARNLLAKKLLRKPKSEASYSEKVRVEKILAKRKNAIIRIARKLLPLIRKKEMMKFSRQSAANIPSSSQNK